VRSAGCLQMKPEQIWQAALGELQLQMTPAMFDTWLRGSRVLAHEEGLFVVGVASGYTKDWLERRLHATIARTLTGIVGRTVEVRFSVSGNDAPPAELLVGAKVFVPAAEVEMPETPSLNPRYIFDNFVVGAHNRMAHARRAPSANRRRARTTRSFCTAAWASAKPTCCRPLAMQAPARACACFMWPQRNSPTI